MIKVYGKISMPPSGDGKRRSAPSVVLSSSCHNVTAGPPRAGLRHVLRDDLSTAEALTDAARAMSATAATMTPRYEVQAQDGGG